MAKFKKGDWIVGPKGDWFQIDDMSGVSYWLLSTSGKRELNSIEIVDKYSVPLSVWDIMNKIPTEVLRNLKFD